MDVLPMLGILGILLVVGGGIAWVLLRGVSAKGGEVDGDATQLASQVISQTQALRNDSLEGDGWDGKNRLGTPPGWPGETAEF